MKKKILLGLLILFVIIQFIPVDRTNPPIDPAKDFLAITTPNGAIGAMIKASCYDCHSNETVYPWYTNVAPFNYWINGHIDNGRKKLNFSEWGDYTRGKAQHKLEECYELTEGTEMPLLSYNIMHAEARMTTEERAQLVAWFKQEAAK